MRRRISLLASLVVNTLKALGSQMQSEVCESEASQGWIASWGKKKNREAERRDLFSVIKIFMRYYWYHLFLLAKKNHTLNAVIQQQQILYNKIWPIYKVAYKLDIYFHSFPSGSSLGPATVYYRLGKVKSLAIFSGPGATENPWPPGPSAWCTSVARERSN